MARMVNNLTKYLKLYVLYTQYSLQVAFANRTTATIFLVAKILRVTLFGAFLWLLLNNTNGIGSYNRDQATFFYLSFILIDTLAQLLFREVYRLRDYILRGNLDFVLLKPVHPFSKILFGGTDGLDFVTLIFLLPVIVIYGQHAMSASAADWLKYLLLLSNSLILATSFHILVLALGIITLSVTNLILIYRDLSSMMRIPLDLYQEPLRSFFTFVVPTGIMMTYPAQALLGKFTFFFILELSAISLLVLVFSTRFWQYSLHYYQSNGS